MTATAITAPAAVSRRAQEILAAVEQSVARTLAEDAPGATRATPRAPTGTRAAHQHASADALSRLVVEVAEHTQQARATIDELSRALERLARHLAFDR